MKWLKVNKSIPLDGSISIPGSKNSSLGLLVCCCMSSEPVILRNIPDILDIRTVIEIERKIGVEIEKGEDFLYVNPTKIKIAEIPPELTQKFRASYYFIGALISKFKKVVVGKPGGDNFGKRPIDQHIKGLEALGAAVTENNDYYVIEAERLKGSEIYFDVVTSGATINLLLAASMAEGRTILRNAARDPEVVDIAVLLSEMGAQIKGAGTDTIIIDGVEELKGCRHVAIPDRLIAGAYLMAAGITKGRVTVHNVIPEHLLSCTAKLEEAGLGIEIKDSCISAYYQGRLKGVKVTTSMYPGLATDFQQPLTAMLIGASSYSEIEDKVYPGRNSHCMQLNKMGAGIFMHGNKYIVPGNRTLKGNWVHASDVRAGICLVLAGLSADGVTCITGVEHIERGYEDIVNGFRRLGGNIQLIEENVEAMDV